MTNINQYRTLVLNADYSPISILNLAHIPVADALTRVFNGTCHVVETYNRQIKTAKKENAVFLPSVIARNQYEDLPRHITDNPVAEYLYYRDHATCAYTGETLTLQKGKPNTLTIDHVIPKSKGGNNTWDNVVACLPNANLAKSDSMPIGLWKPKRKPFKPNYWQLADARKKFPITVYNENWIPYLGNWEGSIHIKEL